MFRSFSIAKKAFEVKIGALLDMILSGSLNHLKRLSIKSCPTCSESMDLVHGIIRTPLVSPWSTMDMMESNPWLGGRSVIMSIEQLVNGLSDWAPAIGWKAGFIGFLLILNCWQFAQPCM